MLALSSTSWALRLSLFRAASEQNIGSLTTLVLTTWGAAGVLICILVALRQTFPPNRSRGLFFLGCSILGYLVPISLQIVVASHITTSLLALIVAMQPIAAALIAYALHSDRITVRTTAGLLLGAASAAIIIYPNIDLNRKEEVPWLLIAILIPISLGIYYNFVSKWWPSGLSGLQVASGEVFLAAPIVTLLYLVFGERIGPSAWESQGYLILGGIVASLAVDTVPYFLLLRWAGPVFTSFGNYILVGAAVFWGAILFGEAPPSRFWLAFAALCTGISLLTWGQRQDRS